MVVYKKLSVKKVAQKVKQGVMAEYAWVQGLPDSPLRARFFNNKQQLPKQWTTTLAEIVEVAKQTQQMLQLNRRNTKVA